jgi:hypothetical protein
MPVPVENALHKPFRDRISVKRHPLPRIFTLTRPADVALETSIVRPVFPLQEVLRLVKKLSPHVDFSDFIFLFTEAPAERYTYGLNSFVFLACLGVEHIPKEKASYEKRRNRW